MAEIINAGDFVTEGERRAAEVLRQLPDSWIVICNKMLPTPAGRSYEIDFIVVASNYIFVLDEKSWGGRISGDDQTWIRPDGPTPSPLNKVDVVARILADHLRKRVTALRGDRTRFVHGGVLLSLTKQLPNIRDSRAPDGIFLISNVCSRLVGLDHKADRSFKAGGSSKVGVYRQDICRALVGFTDRPAIPKTIDNFTIEEEIPGQPGMRIFQAKSSAETPCRLLVYDLGKDPRNINQLRELYKRDYKIWRQLREKLVQEVETPFNWLDDFLVVPTFPPPGKTLTSYPLPETREDVIHELTIMRNAFKVLGLIHKKGVVHRALSPDSVYIVEKSGKKVQVIFANFFAARMEDSHTISVSLDALKLEDPYAAPSLAAGYGMATSQTDVFSLMLVFATRLFGVSIKELRIIDDPTTLPHLGKRWSFIPDEVAAELDTLFRSIIFSKLDITTPSADTVSQRIEELIPRLSSDSIDKDKGDKEQQIIGDRYRVVRMLGQGSMARTLLVVDKEYNIPFALKQFFNPSQIHTQVSNEFRAIQGVRSKYLPQIYDIYPPDHPFHIKMQYIPGPTLQDIAKEFPWPFDRWWKLAQELLSAVKELEDNSLLHRDIKPANIILHEENGYAMLIDFGFATNIGARQEAAGTPFYLPPEAITELQPPPSSDRYAVALVLFYSLTGKFPFTNPEERLDRDRFIIPEMDDVRIPRLAKALLRAIDPDPGRRYDSVDEMRNALQNAIADVDVVPTSKPDIVLEDCINPWVDHLRGLYRNSGIGNADNRGLDSEFVRQTYVHTKLDIKLLPDIFKQHPKAVFLCGNPGDGKTAFLEQVQVQLEQRGATCHLRDMSGWEWHDKDGHIFRSCYDASESHEGQSADDQLTAKLADLQGRAAPTARVTVLVAINDGRMADYFTRHAEQFPWLAEQVEHARTSTTSRTSHVWVVDMKRRAFVTLPGTEEPSVLQNVLDRLVTPKSWEMCTHCTAASSCPILANVQALRTPHIRERLEYLLLLTHLRQQRHITMRDLRSALAYLITGNISCGDVHQIQQGNDAHSTFINLAYWRSAFAPIDRGDELLADMIDLDPARFAHPHIDRFFAFRQESQDESFRASVFLDQQDIPPQRFPRTSDWISALKRRLFFESNPQPPQLQHGDSTLLPDIQWQRLLPYQHADIFLNLINRQIDPKPVLNRLALGILRSDGIIISVPPGYLCVNVAASTEQHMIILKQIPIEEFRLTIPHTSNEMVESIPEVIILDHESGTPRLEITIDLFELLLRMADGLHPGIPEFRPLLEDLVPFKSALLLQSTQELLIIESQRHHHIAQENGRIIRTGH